MLIAFRSEIVLSQAGPVILNLKNYSYSHVAVRETKGGVLRHSCKGHVEFGESGFTIGSKTWVYNFIFRFLYIFKANRRFILQCISTKGRTLAKVNTTPMTNEN